MIGMEDDKLKSLREIANDINRSIARRLWRLLTRKTKRQRPNWLSRLLIFSELGSFWMSGCGKIVRRQPTSWTSE